MTYKELLNIYKNDNNNIKKSEIEKILSPRRISELQEIETIISSRFLYTGPGKWIKILKESNFSKKNK